MFEKIFRIRTKSKNRGATAVEFALIATPFLFLIFALLEVMTTFFVQTTLEAAVAEEARKIKTGQSQTANIDKATFKANICSKLYGLGDCTNRLYIMVQSFDPNNPPTSLSTPWSDGKLTPLSGSDEPYNGSSTSGEMVVVRSYYIWPLLTPLVSNVMTNFKSVAATGAPDLGQTNRLLIATAAFRNEPF